MSGIMATAIYKPNMGQEAALQKLIGKHVASLREYGLVTARDNYVARATDGTFIEVFEWVSADSIRVAHEHPAIARVWEAMGEVADFRSLGELPEAGKQFADFEMM